MVCLNLYIVIYVVIYILYIYAYIYVIYTIFIYNVGLKNKLYLLKKVAASVGWGMKVFSKTPSGTKFV